MLSDLHPSHPHVAAPFLDVLYGALLGVLIVEFPLEHLFDNGLSTTAIFIVVYFHLLAKLVLHWWAVRHDLAVFPAPQADIAKRSQYLLAVLTGFVYAVLIRLLCRWVTSAATSPDFFRAFALIYLFFRLGDVGVNYLAVPRLVRKAPASKEKEWYTHKQRRIISLYLFACIFLAGTFVLPYPTARLLLVATVLVELLVEYRLSQGRAALIETVTIVKMRE
jgi:hypothetical protein